MSWILGLLTGLPGILKDLFGFLNKREDTKAVENTNSSNVSMAAINAEDHRNAGMVDVTKSAMNHPMWWAAWALGVFPVLTYHACIFWVSTFPFWGWTILKVPADQSAFALQVTGWMFGIAGASTLITGIAQAWLKRA